MKKAVFILLLISSFFPLIRLFASDHITKCDSTQTIKRGRKTIKRAFNSSDCHLNSEIITRSGGIAFMNYQRNFFVCGHKHKVTTKVFNDHEEVISRTVIKSIRKQGNVYRKITTISFRDNGKRCRKKVVTWGGMNYFP